MMDFMSPSEMKTNLTAFFAIGALLGGVMATYAGSTRRSILSLWITGLSLGGILLSLGAETLAIIQWILSTLVAISLVFFSTVFGEYPTSTSSSRKVKNSISMGLATCAALSVVGGFTFGIYPMLERNPTLDPEAVRLMGDLVALGQYIAERKIVAIEVLALSLFVVIVGGGSIARPEGKE